MNFFSSQAPAPMAFPMTTPQVPVYGMVSLQKPSHKINLSLAFQKDAKSATERSIKSVFKR